MKINDIVGNGISRILYKWVNYGKGWRPRWFVLQDDALTYYKIHGPDKIVVNQGTEKGSKVIGEESLQKISRYRNGASLPQQNLPRKPFDEIHLKVKRQILGSNLSLSRNSTTRFITPTQKIEPSFRMV